MTGFLFILHTVRGGFWCHIEILLAEYAITPDGLRVQDRFTSDRESTILRRVIFIQSYDSRKPWLF